MIHPFQWVIPAVFFLAVAAFAWVIMLFQNMSMGMPPQLSFLGSISKWILMRTGMMLRRLCS